MERYLKLEGAPYKDDYMDYNYEEHMYEPLINGFTSKYGATVFGKLTNPEKKILLEEARDNIYLYLKMNSRKGNYDVIEYRIAKKDYNGEYSARLMLRNAIYSLIKYAIRSGGDMLGDHHGVNLKKGQVITDFDKIRAKLKVSSNVEDYLNAGENSLMMKANLQYTIDPEDRRVGY